MENTETSSVTIAVGGVIQFKGLASEPDVSEEILAAEDFTAPEDTTESKAEESVASDASVEGQPSSPPAGQQDPPPAPARGEVTPQSDTSFPGTGYMAQTSPLGFSTHGKVSHFVKQ